MLPIEIKDDEDEFATSGPIRGICDRCVNCKLWVTGELDFVVRSGRMNDWQKKFSQTMEAVRTTASERFESVADQIFDGVFAEFDEFTTGQGLTASAPLSQTGVRTFKFAVMENAYALLSFRLCGMEHCEAQTEFAIPGSGKIDLMTARITLVDVDEEWSRGVFEQSLDRLADACVDALADAPAGKLSKV